MPLSPDEIIYFQFGAIKISATLVFTWAVMLLIVITSKLIARSYLTSDKPSRWQRGLEIVVLALEKQIADVGVTHPRNYLPFLGTLFVFICVSNLLTLFPFYEAPTGSLSTTTALAGCVFFAVPFYGIKKLGLKNYLATYTQPTIFMLPFNVIGELSRTLALAVRLFGNIMSGTMILAILLIVAPFVFPIIMTLLGLLTGMVQAYIFFILATVYIAAATTTATQTPNNTQSSATGDNHG